MTKIHVPVAETVASIGRTARLWRFGGLSPWQLIVRSIRGYRQHHFDARSAQIAYYSMLSLFPLLILLIAALAQLPLKGILDNALDAADRALPDAIYNLLVQQIHDIQARSTVGLVTASLGGLTIAGSQVFLAITEGLNRAYDVQETRRIWRVYGLAFLLTVAASLLVLVALVLMIVGPLLSTWIARFNIPIPYLRTMLQSGVRWGVVGGCLWLSTSAIYCLVPNVKLSWYWFSPGSVFAVVGWIVTSQGFRIYVENFGNYNTTYGALGGVIVLIVWLNLTGAVLLMGGQINGVIHRAEVVQLADSTHDKTTPAAISGR
ncbi:MAG TPA: YihY/virulence factor BrkB family protein [Planctomycetaceae bacterium]|jgi:membrane protein